MGSSGHSLGAAAMGCLSSLVLSPCVTPPLVGALSYIAKSGNSLLGGSALFSLGFGMGAPLLLIGTSAGKWLPKAGYWMNAVKSFFGFLMLGVAIYLISRIIPATITLALWGCLLVFAGIYSDAFVSGDSHRAKVKQACGMIILVYGLVLLIGASMGSTSYLQPLAGAFANKTMVTESPTQVVKTVDELHQAIIDSKDKPVLLDFYADWCTSCKVLEQSLLGDIDVKQMLRQFSVIKVDITESGDAQQAILNEYQVIAPPTFIFMNKAGEELANMRLVGEVSKANFMQQLEAAKELS
jgi:thiol:disulfide interchange protein DsbD